MHVPPDTSDPNGGAARFMRATRTSGKIEAEGRRDSHAALDTLFERRECCAIF
jgi:hypothetical protein